MQELRIKWKEYPNVFCFFLSGSIHVQNKWLTDTSSRLLFPFTSTSIACACLKTHHLLFLYLARTYHPHLQCAKPILCAHKCHIPVCQETCWELSHIKSYAYINCMPCKNANWKDPIIHSEVMLKWNTLCFFFSPFLLPEAVIKLEGEPFQTWQLIAGRNKAGRLAKINTLYK